MTEKRLFLTSVGVRHLSHQVEPRLQAGLQPSTVPAREDIQPFRAKTSQHSQNKSFFFFGKMLPIQPLNEALINID